MSTPVLQLIETMRNVHVDGYRDGRAEARHHGIRSFQCSYSSDKPVGFNMSANAVFRSLSNSENAFPSPCRIVAAALNRDLDWLLPESDILKILIGFLCKFAFDEERLAISLAAVRFLARVLCVHVLIAHG